MRMRDFAIALPATIPATAAMAGPGDEFGYGHMWGGGYGMMGGGLMMLLFWGVIIALIFVAVRWYSDKGQQTGSNALKILEERFARGEIDDDEFQRRKAALDG